MNGPRIQDNASLKKLREDMDNLRRFKTAYPFLKPFLKLFGVQIEQMEAAISEAAALENTALDMLTIPDRFNALFVSRGWIIYEMLNFEVVQAAVAKAEAGDIDGAEQNLVEHYTKETIDWGLKFMLAINAFRPRESLARKALDDYVAGRYYACIPVVLMLLDGFIDDLGYRGFFAEGVDLEAWDSIAAHSSGLPALARVLGAVRTHTTTETLSIPYRHGILHGHDLNYDNKMVAAKAWAALFATRDLAIKAERKQRIAPPEQPGKTWKDIFRQVKETADHKAKLEVWVPRELQIGHDVPSTGRPEDFGDGTPERRLVEFLTYWRVRNYGYMARCLPVSDRSHLSGAAGDLRKYYEDKRLQAFELLELSDDAAALTVIKAKLVYEEHGTEITQISDFRLLNEDGNGSVIVRGAPGSSWGIYTAYV